MINNIPPTQQRKTVWAWRQWAAAARWRRWSQLPTPAIRREGAPRCAARSASVRSILSAISPRLASFSCSLRRRWWRRGWWRRRRRRRRSSVDRWCRGTTGVRHSSVAWRRALLRSLQFAVVSWWWAMCPTAFACHRYWNCCWSTTPFCYFSSPTSDLIQHNHQNHITITIHNKHTFFGDAAALTAWLIGKMPSLVGGELPATPAFFNASV